MATSAIDCRPHNDHRNMVRKQEPDGSWKVYCRRCLAFVGRLPAKPSSDFPADRYRASLAAIEVLS